MYEIKHLKSIKALVKHGSLVSAAAELNMTVSALSHQFKELEYRLGGCLFKRKTSPTELTGFGEELYRVANQVLPTIELSLITLKQGIKKTISISSSCHACFQWLLPAIKQFNLDQNQISVDLKSSTAKPTQDVFETMAADLVFASELPKNALYQYEEIGDFELVMVCHPMHTLAKLDFVVAQDFDGQILLSYPIDKSELDVYQHVISKADSVDVAFYPVEQVDVMMQMVVNDFGIAVLPDWVVQQPVKLGFLAAKPVTARGLRKRLYGVYHSDDPKAAEISRFLKVAKQSFLALT